MGFPFLQGGVVAYATKRPERRGIQDERVNTRKGLDRLSDGIRDGRFVSPGRKKIS